MTLGTNASLAEQIEYAPSEINFDLIVEALEELEDWRELGESAWDVEGRIDDLIVEALEELEDWRELGESAWDVEGRIDDLEYDINTKDKDIEELEAKVDELSEEISYLKNRIEELECALEDAENQA